jgi:hypothetical protein
VKENEGPDMTGWYGMFRGSMMWGAWLIWLLILIVLPLGIAPLVTGPCSPTFVTLSLKRRIIQ